MSVIGLILYFSVGFTTWVVFTVDEFYYLPNENKRKLACLLLGPGAWVVEVFTLIRKAITPLIDWFSEE